MLKFVLAALLFSTPFAVAGPAPEEQRNAWKIEMHSKSAAGMESFRMTVPYDGCQTAPGTGDGILKVCMGNVPTRHTAHVWLVAGATQAAKPGDEKFVDAKRFSLGFDGAHGFFEDELFSVDITRSTR